ncbi:MAG: DUF748 domain-containing protein [Nevskia sp.]|nr:DUF748 domain-containing protein [Nevskia sp.]
MGENRPLPHAQDWRRWARSRRVRKWSIAVAAAVALYAAIGFFAVPALARKPAERMLGAALSRPASIGRIRLNPFTLKLQVEAVHLGGRQAREAFVDIGRITVRVSWASLLRLKPVIGEFALDAPRVHVVRSAPQQFNFSDLLAQPARPAAPSGKAAPQFAVYNIRIADGAVDFDDRVLGQQHRLDHLQLGIPFVANLPSKIDVFVEPQLSATVDGSAFSLGGRTKPFSPTRESEIALKLDKLQLPQLLAYAPTPLPVALGSGWLSADLKLRFRLEQTRQQTQPVVEVGGSVDAGDIDVKDGAGHTLLQTRAVHVAADSVQPLRGIFHLGELRIDQPVLDVQRDAGGVINLARLQPAPAQAAAPAAAGAPPTAPAAPAPAAAAAGPDVVVRHFVLDGGTVNVEDYQSGHPATLALEQIQAEVADLSTQGTAPGHYKLQAALKSGGTLGAEGGFNLKAATLDGSAGIHGLELPPLQPFAGGVLAARLASGSFDADTTLALDWSKTPAAVKLAPARLELHRLKLVAAKVKEPLVGLDHGSVDIDEVNLAERRAKVSSVELDGLALHAQRSAGGDIDLASLVRSGAPANKAPRRGGAKGTARAQRGAPAAAPAPAAAWHYSVGRVALKRSAVSYADAAHPEAKLKLTALDLKIQDIGDDLRKPWRLTTSAAVNGRGRFAASGTVAPSPLRVRLHFNARQIDVAPFQSYVSSQLNASVATAWLGVSGDLDLAQGRAGLAGRFKGDAGLSRVSLIDKISADTFATWGTLNVAQIDAAFGGAQTSLDVGSVNLTDFYARVLLDSKGQLNLGHLVKHANAPEQSLTRSAAAPAPPPASAPAASPAPAAPAAAPLHVRIGAINLHNGGVNYTDNFIKPNFSANLARIEGQIGTIGTDTAAPAPLQVRAQLESSGPVAIDGSINPLAKPAFLDLTASARGVTLTNFSPYSEKYAGYRILKGTLSVDLHYKLDHDALNANNHLFIDQFTFGDRVDSPSATSLPVRLAISLLKDSHGQIDVNLPVSGSLSDPQFSVGGLVWRAVLNLLEKAITSPFSLLASAFGGSEELGYVAYAPGSAVIGADQAAKLETLRKALADRPGVNLDVAGRIDPSADRAGLKQLSVERQVKQQKFDDLADKGVAPDFDSLVVPSGEYGKYLERAYSAAKFAKPRNFIGLAKSLPPDQMRNLMLDNAPAGDAELRDLAERRAAAVQHWFDGKLPPGRIFITAPKLDTSGIKDSGPATRADFALH